MFFVYIGVIGGEGGGGIGFVIGILFFNLFLSKDLVMFLKVIGFVVFCNWKINIIIYWIIVLYMNWLKFVFLKIKWNYS